MRENVGTDGKSDVEELEKGESGQEQYETQGRCLESLQEDYAGLRETKLRAEVRPERRDRDQNRHDRQYGSEIETEFSDPEKMLRDSFIEFGRSAQPEHRQCNQVNPEPIGVCETVVVELGEQRSAHRIKSQIGHE